MPKSETLQIVTRDGQAFWEHPEKIFEQFLSDGNVSLERVTMGFLTRRSDVHFVCHERQQREQQQTQHVTKSSARQYHYFNFTISQQQWPFAFFPNAESDCSATNTKLSAQRATHCLRSGQHNGTRGDQITSHEQRRRTSLLTHGVTHNAREFF